MEAKQAVRDLLDKLPDACTLDDVLSHVYVLQRIAQGLAEAEAGGLISHEQVEQELRRRWLLGDASLGRSRPGELSKRCARLRPVA
jgi:predicted transcriptional regulator